MTAEVLAPLAAGAAAIAAVWAAAGPEPAVAPRLRTLGAAAPSSPRPSPVVLLGRRLRAMRGLPPDGAADQVVGRVVVGALVAALAEPMLGVTIAGTAGVVSVLRRRRRARERRLALVDQLPEVVDLLTLASSAGSSVPLAVRTVARYGVGDLAEALGRASEVADRGVALADALEDVPRHLGDEVRPLVRVLAGALRDGTAVVPALERLAGEVRVARRRAAEERARRLPVVLLLPLVVCVLPAFGLLTVVPLLVGALDGFIA